jgi:hypothetical protein
MIKGFSIFLSLLMLAAILHLSVATHYCGGKEVATKVSLSGKLASYDMGCSETELPVTGTNFTKHCCDDILIICGIANYYEPTFSFVPDSHQYNSQVFNLHNGLPISFYTDLVPFRTNVNPCGALPFTNLSLSYVCVFRI